MKHTAVIYQLRYGSTRQYAQWIVRDLRTELLERSAVSPASLRGYDVVMYGGGLYADGVAGIDLVAKYPCPPLVVFTMGLVNPVITDYSETLDRNFSPEQREKLKVSHLRSTMGYGRLGPVHRGVMAMMKEMTIDSRTPEERIDEDRLMLETCGKSVDLIEEASITPLVEYVRGLF